MSALSPEADILIVDIEVVKCQKRTAAVARSNNWIWTQAIAARLTFLRNQALILA
jgi:hypothetical protein